MEGARDLFFYKSTYPIHEGFTSWSKHHPKAFPFYLITLGIKILIYEFGQLRWGGEWGADTDIQTIAAEKKGKE